MGVGVSKKKSGNAAECRLSSLQPGDIYSHVCVSKVTVFDMDKTQI